MQEINDRKLSFEMFVDSSPNEPRDHRLQRMDEIARNKIAESIVLDRIEVQNTVILTQIRFSGYFFTSDQVMALISKIVSRVGNANNNSL